MAHRRGGATPDDEPEADEAEGDAALAPPRAPAVLKNDPRLPAGTCPRCGKHFGRALRGHTRFPCGGTP